MATTLGRRLRAVRMMRGVGQAELARQIGVSKATLSLLERDHIAQTNTQTLTALAYQLDVRADWLLGLVESDVPLRLHGARPRAAS